MAVRFSSTLRFRAMLLVGSIAFSSCAGRDREALTIATNFPPAECDRMEKALDDPAVRVAWIRVPERDDPATVLERGARIDVLLGAPSESFRRLQRQGTLEPLGAEPSWRVVRRTALGRAVPRGTTTNLRPSDVTLDDPRHSPVALAEAQATLDRRGWREGYRMLLATASHRPLIGDRPGASVDRLLRGEIPAALTRADDVPKSCEFLADVPTLMMEDGVGIVRGTSHPDSARRFLAALEREGNASIPSPGKEVPLLSELLGAVLVDAQPELIEALAAVNEARVADRAEKWLVPPPWPPASIAKLKRSDPSGALVESLAEQMVPDFKPRVWLLDSWKGASRPIDADLLRELASAADGHLIAEPRFRAWLAVEWRTWARQCYRRVAREARRMSP